MLFMCHETERLAGLTGPTTLSAIWSAMTDELPWAMFAKGPACTKTGVCSTVC